VNVTTCQLCHRETRNFRMADSMEICDACAVSKLFQETVSVLCDVAQILDGWHNDGTTWSEHDESVRKRVSALQIQLENASLAIHAPAIARLRTQALELEPELLRLMAQKSDPQRQSRLAEEINICRTAALWLEKQPECSQCGSVLVAGEIGTCMGCLDALRK